MLTDIEQAAEAYEAQGFTVLRQWLAPDVIANLAQEVDRIHAAGRITLRLMQKKEAGYTCLLAR